MMDEKINKHVFYCSSTGNQIHQTGADAERLTVNYLLDNLNPRVVGDYRILVNYNLPFQNAGGRGTLEIDLVLINKFGVFPIEVKDWRGVIEAYDGYWIQDKKYKHSDVFGLINHKARVLHGNLFGKNGQLSDINQVSVAPLIVLFRGKRNFQNHSQNDASKVVGVENDLILNVSSNKLLFHGNNSRVLTDIEIQNISEKLFRSNGNEYDEMIGRYRILGELSSGDLYKSFEAIHVDFPDVKVRVKVYNLTELPSSSIEQANLLIRHGTEAVWGLGNHPNILQTRDFFSDVNNPNIFYEITEPVIGERLDEFLSRFGERIPLPVQFECIKQLCSALIYAHSQGVFHRNINLETVFIIKGDKIKLADFDFAKIVGKGTISRPGEILVDSQFTAPELIFNPSSANPASDLYSLGVLWYFLANHPNQEPFLGEKSINRLDLSENLKVLINKMTNKAPANRPQNAEKILKQINEFDNPNQH